MWNCHGLGGNQVWEHDMETVSRSALKASRIRWSRRLSQPSHFYPLTASLRWKIRKNGIYNFSLITLSPE